MASRANGVGEFSRNSKNKQLESGVWASPWHRLCRFASLSRAFARPLLTQRVFAGFGQPTCAGQAAALIRDKHRYAIVAAAGGPGHGSEGTGWLGVGAPRRRMSSASLLGRCHWRTWRPFRLRTRARAPLLEPACWLCASSDADTWAQVLAGNCCSHISGACGGSSGYSRWGRQCECVLATRLRAAEQSLICRRHAAGSSDSASPSDGDEEDETVGDHVPAGGLGHGQAAVVHGGATA